MRTRQQYGDAYILVLKCLLHRLYTLSSGKDEDTLSGQTRLPNAEEPSDSGYLNYRYHGGLKKQLESSVIYLLLMLHESDCVELLQIDLGKQCIMMSAISSAVKAFTEQHCLQETGESGTTFEAENLALAIKALIEAGGDENLCLEGLLKELQCKHDVQG